LILSCPSLSVVVPKMEREWNVGGTQILPFHWSQRLFWVWLYRM